MKVKKAVKADKVILKGVSFSYGDGERVLNEANLCLSAPGNVCIMGKSGSGKTTLANIFCLEEVFSVHGNRPVGEGGQKLSGGERKRLRIAQTLANNSVDIYISDELTSSLDKLSASRIMKNILELKLGKLCIFIEHNSSTQTLMDEVITVGEGRLSVSVV